MIFKDSLWPEGKGDVMRDISGVTRNIRFYCLRLISNFLILDSNVDGLMSKILAAPFSPRTCQLVISKTAMMFSLSLSSKVRWCKAPDFTAIPSLVVGSQSPNSSCFPELIINALSTVSSSSRTLRPVVSLQGIHHVLWHNLYLLSYLGAIDVGSYIDSAID